MLTVTFFFFFQEFVNWLQSPLPEMNVPNVWTEERPLSNCFSLFA